MMMMMMVMMMWMVFGDEMGKKGAPHYPFALFFFVYSCNSFFFFSWYDAEVHRPKAI